MSFVCIVTPLISSWPIFATAGASVAGMLGFRIYTDAKTQLDTEMTDEAEIEINENRTDESTILGKVLDEKGVFVLKKDDVAIYFERDMRGHCKIRACGKNKSQEELKKIGRQVFNKVMQEYAYRTIKEELKNKGFSVINENTLDNGTIKIQVRKWT